MLVESALFFLIGLVLAGLVWVFLNEKNIKRLLGRNRNQAVLRAAIIGIPLPLCSCSVLPVASQLRASGLSKGGTVSFLISTPESSLDSIMLTYSLTDPLLTVARPIAAFLTAVIGGTIENSFGHKEADQFAVAEPVAACGCDCQPVESAPASMPRRLWQGLKHSFTVIISDLAPYLFLGYVLAGLAAVAFSSPLDFGSGSGWWAYLAALVIGVPMYICATSSTPLAAVLLGAGFPAGAVMVFLMVGPATNLATLAVTKKILGLASTVRYVVSIVVVSLLCGFALDWCYRFFDIQADYQTTAMTHGTDWLAGLSGLVLAGLILFHTGRWARAKLRK